MDIEKEKSAFLDIYKYYPSAIKFTFDVENECFVLSKKNPLDHEVATISQMNQQWYAWLACAKSKAQAVMEITSIGNELQSWVAVNSFSADDGEGVLPVVDANAIAEKIEELTGASQ